MVLHYWQLAADLFFWLDKLTWGGSLLGGCQSHNTYSPEITASEPLPCTRWPCGTDHLVGQICTEWTCSDLFNLVFYTCSYVIEMIKCLFMQSNILDALVHWGPFNIRRASSHATWDLVVHKSAVCSMLESLILIPLSMNHTCVR